MKIEWNLIWESAKEPLRLLVLAIIPFIVAATTGIDAQWAIYATIVLRFIDKYLHEKAIAEPVKTRNEGLLGVTGLTGF
jgi:hypothetical protein